MPSIIAYTYEAAMHCPDCTRDRFAAPYSGTWHPRDEHGRRRLADLRRQRERTR